MCFIHFINSAMDVTTNRSYGILPYSPPQESALMGVYAGDHRSTYKIIRMMKVPFMQNIRDREGNILTSESWIWEPEQPQTPIYKVIDGQNIRMKYVLEERISRWDSPDNPTDFVSKQNYLTLKPDPSFIMDVDTMRPVWTPSDMSTMDGHQSVKKLNGRLQRVQKVTDTRKYVGKDGTIVTEEFHNYIRPTGYERKEIYGGHLITDYPLHLPPDTGLYGDSSTFERK